MIRLRCRAALLAFLPILFSTPASAQQAEGYALNRFDPSERGSEWFALESLDLRGEGRIALGVVGDWGHKPLVLYAPDGTEKSLLVKDQLFLHVGGGVIVANRFRFSASLPIAAYEAGEQGTLGTTTYVPPSSASIGDLRLGADARLVGELGNPITLAIGVAFFYFTRQNYVIFNGHSGFAGLAAPVVFGINWHDPLPFYYLSLAVALASYAAVLYLSRATFGLTLQAICDKLNSEGVPTPRGGTMWRPTSLRSILAQGR